MTPFFPFHPDHLVLVPSNPLLRRGGARLVASFPTAPPCGLHFFYPPLPSLFFATLQGGKQKSKKKVVSKIKQTVPKAFKCPFCSHEGSCEVKMNRETEVGTIKCRVCGEGDESRITTLSDPVDVYVKWIDELEAMKSKA